MPTPPRTLGRLLADGPLPALPAALDALAEAWARASGRARMAVRVALSAVLALSATGGLLRGPWGPTVEVVVATRTVPAGTALAAVDLGRAAWPAELLPPDVVHDPTAVPDGSVARGVLPAGMPVSRSQLELDGIGGLAGPGRALVAVPAELVPALTVGARVDLASSAGGAAGVIATDAVLAADDGSWRWFEVDRGAAAAVARAVSDGALLVALLPRPAAAP